MVFRLQTWSPLVLGLGSRTLLQFFNYSPKDQHSTSEKLNHALYRAEYRHTGCLLAEAEVRALGLKQLAESGIDESELKTLQIEFVTASDIKRRRLPFAAAPGILHTYQPSGLQRVRYLRGYEPPDPARPGKLMRYGHPRGVASELYRTPMIPNWDEIFKDPTIPIGFTEGWLKANAAAKYLHKPVLAYDGINNFAKNGVLLPVYNEIIWRGRTVFLINDKDVPENHLSLQSENLHARLLTERAVDAVWICRYPKNCRYGKMDDALVTKGAKWFDQQVLKKAVLWDPSMAEDVIPPGLAEAPLHESVIIPPLPDRAMYGIAKKITQQLETPLSLTYPTVLVALAAADLPTFGETRSNLYTVLLNPSGGGKSVVSDRVEVLLKPRSVRLIRTTPASDRGLLKILQLGDAPSESKASTNQHINPKDFNLMQPSVLYIADELVNVLCKANIDGSNLYSCLCELWSHSRFSVADRKGREESSPVIFNLLGNLPCANPEQFTELFGSDAQLGFYRRCIFGLGLRAEPFVFRPMGEELQTCLARFEPSRLEVPRDMYGKVNAWKEQSVNDQQRERRSGLTELILRVALVTSSANRDEMVTERALQAATEFIEWQEKIRTAYAPAKTKSPYAQCMDMVCDYLEKEDGLVNWTRVSQYEHWHRREFSQYLSTVKSYLLREGLLVPDRQKGLFYYRKAATLIQP